MVINQIKKFEIVVFEWIMGVSVLFKGRLIPTQHQHQHQNQCLAKPIL